jgi:sialidase-1
MSKTSYYSIERSIIIDRDPFTYIVFPTIVVLDNGEWLIAYRHARRRQPYQHPPSEPSYLTVTSRSADQGRTWSRPQVAPGYEWYGTENPGLLQASNGDVLLTHFRFHWYPLDVGYKRWKAGERIALPLPERGWSDNLREEDWRATTSDRARANDGTYVHISADRGRTFAQTVRIDTTPYREGYTRVGAIELSDGRIAYALAEHFPPYNKHIYLVTSRDVGRTWDSPTLIAKSREQAPEKIGSWNEPHIAEVAPGELYCILRDRINHEYLWGCRSSDGGKTWSDPEPTPMYGHPGHLLVLRDGRLLCTYGRRKSPWGTFGVRACLSDDGGRTWDIAREIIIRDDFPNANLGYPQTIEYEPGRLFCAYYGEDGEGVTCVQGTWLTLA